MFSSDEGVFPNVKFGFAKAKVVWNVEFTLLHKAFDLRSHRCVKEGKVCGKRVLAFDFCLVFISWNQSGYGKANKSLCLCMHSKFGKLT